MTNHHSLKNIEPQKPANMPAVRWADPNNPTGLIHCYRLPDDLPKGERVPAVVMVHGWHGNEGVMWVFARAVPPGTAIITPRALKPHSESNFVWFEYNNDRLDPNLESLKAGRTALDRFVDKLPHVYPIDPARLVLVGFSQGGMMVNDYTLRQPEKVLGVGCLAGYVTPLPEHGENMTALNGLPVFITHGERDKTVPVDFARQLRNMYASYGADVTYSEHNVGHKLHADGLRRLKAWLGEVLS